MPSNGGGTPRDRETIFREVVAILDDMTGDWDVQFEGGIRPETRLIADLAFESVDVVQLIVAVEEHFARRDLPFEHVLMKDGQYVDELTVGELVDFLVKHLGAS